MSFLMKIMTETESTQNTEIGQLLRSKKRGDELTLIMSTVDVRTSSMPEDLKRKIRDRSLGLKELFIATVERKGEGKELQVNRLSDSELEIEGISQMTLHSFLLKAEELGKKITYTRSLKVEITD